MCIDGLRRGGRVGQTRWRRMRGSRVLAVSIVLGACASAALPGLASGAPFQRGDVFFTDGTDAPGTANIQEYSPSGELQQTIPGTLGATAMCFDPSGGHLILPGVGLFDSSGNPLASNWASVTDAGRCVADGFGDVYVSSEASDSITKYDLTGDLIQTFTPAIYGGGIFPWGIDLAPDECTIYYGAFQDSFNGRFNVCTNTQGPTFSNNSIENSPDDLRVLPNGQILVTTDVGGLLYDASGSVLREYVPGIPISNDLRSMSLDPDGTSFWMSGAYGVVHYDINSGSLLSMWCRFSFGVGNCTGPSAAFGLAAVYGPPLVGNADVENHVDHNPGGTAEAFPVTVSYSGQISSLDLYVNSTSTASQVIVGVYSNKNGKPGTLQNQAMITNVVAGSWNDVQIPSIPVTAGQRVWIALLGPNGGGTIRFRDDAQSSPGEGSQTSAQTHLTALPATWSVGTDWPTGNLSAYGQ